MYDWTRIPRIWSGTNTLPMYCKNHHAEINEGQYKRRSLKTCDKICQKNGHIDRVIPGLRKKNWKDIIQKGLDRISKWKTVKRDYKKRAKPIDSEGNKSIELLLIKYFLIKIFSNYLYFLICIYITFFMINLKIKF